MLDVKKIRADFPILKRQINGKPLVYLDNAATSQKPLQVIRAITDYYSFHNANIHRGAHTLGEEATELFENSRKVVADFIGARSSKEIIFTKNSTESLNLVAYSWGRENIKEDDEIITTNMEHHSDFVPWQVLAQEKKAKFLTVPFNKEGLLDEEELIKFLNPKTKLVALVHISNTLGTINPVRDLTAKIKNYNPKIAVVIDASQSVPHMPLSVTDIGCDFLAFTGHKMLSPMGIGVLWGKEELLKEMAPFMTGGGMIKEVDNDHSSWAEIPDRFEAGTPNVEGAVGMAAAIDYLKAVGMENIRDHEKELTEYALSKLEKIEGLNKYGPNDKEKQGGIITFNIEGVHPHDVSTVFDKMGICVRTGHHCTMPLHQKLGVPATVRASFYLYNTEEEIDKMIEAIKEVKNTFKLT